MAAGALRFGVTAHPDASRYGRYLWQIGLTDGREVAVHADRIEINGAGVLLAWQETDYRDGAKPARVARDAPLMAMALPPGQWTHVYAASVRDGSPVIVERLPEPDRAAP